MQDNSLPNSTQPTPAVSIAPVQSHVDDYIPPTIAPTITPIADPIVAVNPVVSNSTAVPDPVAGQSDQADLNSPSPSFKSGLPVSSVDTSDSPGVSISDKPSFGDSSSKYPQSKDSLNEYSSNDFKDPRPASPATGSDFISASPTVGSDFISASPTVGSVPTPEPISPPKPQVPATGISDDSSSAQKLETQNIFDLLGVSDGTQKEKEEFLDELQEVIWEDFVESDIELLLTEEEGKDFATIKAEGETPEVQEKMLVFLEKLIPDLEEIMMDKALELKGEMVQERISGMREFHVDNQEALAQIEKAEKAIIDDRWAEVSTILNGISS